MKVAFPFYKVHRFLEIPTKCKHSDDFISHQCVKCT